MKRLNIWNHLAELHEEVSSIRSGLRQLSQRVEVLEGAASPAAAANALAFSPAGEGLPRKEAPVAPPPIPPVLPPPLPPPSFSPTPLPPPALLSETPVPKKPAASLLQTELAQPGQVAKPSELAALSLPPGNATLDQPRRPEKATEAAKLQQTVEPIQPMQADCAHGEQAESLELKFGSYWMVRIGVVLLLTGVVFLGKLSYDKWVELFGPAGPVGKLFFMYLGAGAMIVLASVIRKRGAKFNNYAAVLEAGGLASIYFTSYAAHHLSALRIISNPIISGFMLLGCCGLIFWRAERLKSPLLSLFGVGLGFYSVAIGGFGTFTLPATVLFTAAALGYAARSRQFNLLLTAGAGAYISTAWFTFTYSQQASGHHLPVSGTFLAVAALWALLVFALRRFSSLSVNKISAVSICNDACLLLLALQVWFLGGLEGYSFEIITGTCSGLTIAAYLLNRKHSEGSAVSRLQLVLPSLGLAAALIGATPRDFFSLVMTVQSAVFLLIGLRLQMQTFRFLGMGMGLFSVIILLASSAPSAQQWILALLSTAAFLFVAIYRHRFDLEENKSGERLLFLMFGCATLLFQTLTGWRDVESLPMILGIEAVLFLALARVIAPFQVLVIAPIFLVSAWTNLVRLSWNNLAIASLALLLVLTISLLQAIKIRARGDAFREKVSLAWQFLGGLLMLVGVFNFISSLPPHARMLACSLFGYLFVLAGIGLSAIYLLVLGDLALVGAVCSVSLAFSAGKANVWCTGGTILLFLALSLPLLKRSDELSKRTGVPARVFLEHGRIVALLTQLMLAFFSYMHVPSSLRFPFHLLLASGMFVADRGSAAVRWGIVTNLLMASAYLMLPSPTQANWAGLGGCLLLLAADRYSRFGKDALESGQRMGLSLFAIAVVAVFVTEFIFFNFRGYFAVGWAMLSLALLLTGMFCKTRTYRLSGLSLLCFTLLWVVVVDVWNLGSVYRVASFLVLGIVLLVVGYLYNRYADQVKKFL